MPCSRRRRCVTVTAVLLGMLGMCLPGFFSVPAQAQYHAVSESDFKAGEIRPVTETVKPMAESPGDSLEDSPAQTGSNDSGKVLEAVLIKNEAYPIDLPTVLRLVDDQNLTLLRSEMQKKVESSRFYQRITDILPDFTGIHDQNRFQGVIQIFGSETITIYRTTIEPRMMVTQRIYPGGKQVFDILAARKRVKAGKSLVEESYQQQLARATEEYYTLLATHVNREFAMKSLEEAQEQVKINEGRFKAGVGTRLEVMQAKTLEAQRNRDFIRANNAIFTSEQALLNRLNLDTSLNLIPNDEDAHKKQLISKEVASDVLVQQAVRNNPTLARLDQEIKALQWDSRSVASEVIPFVDGMAYVSYRGPHFDQLGLSRYGGFTIQTEFGNGAGLALPARWLERHRLVKLRKLDREAAVRDVESDVINAYLNSQASESTIEAAQEERAAAEESFRLASGRYRAGVGTNLDVITAESSLSQSRSNLVRAVLDFNIAQIQLLEALGEVSPETLQNGLKAEGEGKKPDEDE